MAGSEQGVKKAAELKLWLEGRIAQLQEEIERLRESLAYVDATLRATTFKPAIEMMPESREIPEVRELKRDKGRDVIAVASVTAARVSIEPKGGFVFKQNTPPFKTFLMAKILQGMASKDEELAASGKLPRGSGLRFSVEESQGAINRLVIENYRDKARLNEILNTVAWTFSRMLEK
ncbi:MAG TPA: hypothetical protein VKF15_04375 [Nitrososphaerales archaeon]|nr:hypothetical protein [Nitrososphaerales archaeon]